MRALFLTAMTLALTTADAGATRVAPPAGSCAMKETVTVGVTINNISVTSIADAKAKYDQQAAKVSDIATELKLENLQVQNMNYNIYSQGNGDYNMSGSFQYRMPDSNTAFKFATMLEQKGFSPSINSNSYLQGNCN